MVGVDLSQALKRPANVHSWPGVIIWVQLPFLQRFSDVFHEETGFCRPLMGAEAQLKGCMGHSLKQPHPFLHVAFANSQCVSNFNVES
jgi:hypothetical protein